MITKGSTWQDKQKPTRLVRVLTVYPAIVRFADLKHGKITATTYSYGHQRFLERFHRYER